MHINKLMILFAFFLISFSSHISATVSPLNATYKVDTVWATAYKTTVTITNNTNTNTSSWTASFTMPQKYVLSTHTSGGVFSVQGQNVTVKNVAGNAVIAPGKSTTFNMIINMPLSGATVINNLQAIANGGTIPPPNPPAVPPAPALNAISNASSSPNYTVFWSGSANATSYTLQQATTAAFSNPIAFSLGNVLSKSFTNQPAGTYYYRVLATNSAGNSPFSNTQNTTVTNSTPIPPITTGIEHSAWYIDWTSWFTGPPFVIPAHNNVLNIFVGTLMFGTDGKPTIGGFGNMTLPQMDAFTAYCAAQNPPIAVKASIGGAGGMYDRCWDLLTASNVQSFAQGLVDFCHAHGLIGIDFDYEHYTSVDQEKLVGLLIKQFKTIDPKLQTSLCTNAGFGPNFPWQAHVKNVLDSALISTGNCAVDRLYIMSYYNSIEEEKTWVNGWADWVIQNYGFTPARVSVGIDDFDAHAYDPVVFAAWAATMGYSTAHWAFDPARPN